MPPRPHKREERELLAKFGSEGAYRRFNKYLSQMMLSGNGQYFKKDLITNNVTAQSPMAETIHQQMLLITGKAPKKTMTDDDWVKYWVEFRNTNQKLPTYSLTSPKSIDEVKAIAAACFSDTKDPQKGIRMQKELITLYRIATMDLGDINRNRKKLGKQPLIGYTPEELENINAQRAVNNREPLEGEYIAFLDTLNTEEASLFQTNENLRALNKAISQRKNGLSPQELYDLQRLAQGIQMEIAADPKIEAEEFPIDVAGIFDGPGRYGKPGSDGRFSRIMKDFFSTAEIDAEKKEFLGHADESKRKDSDFISKSGFYYDTQIAEYLHPKDPKNPSLPHPNETVLEGEMIDIAFEKRKILRGLLMLNSQDISLEDKTEIWKKVRTYVNRRVNFMQETADHTARFFDDRINYEGGVEEIAYLQWLTSVNTSLESIARLNILAQTERIIGNAAASRKDLDEHARKVAGPEFKELDPTKFDTVQLQQVGNKLKEQYDEVASYKARKVQAEEAAAKKIKEHQAVVKAAEKANEKAKKATTEAIAGLSAAQLKEQDSRNLIEEMNGKLTELGETIPQKEAALAGLEAEAFQQLKAALTEAENKAYTEELARLKKGFDASTKTADDVFYSSKEKAQKEFDSRFSALEKEYEKNNAAAAAEREKGRNSILNSLNMNQAAAKAEYEKKMAAASKELSDKKAAASKALESNKAAALRASENNKAAALKEFNQNKAAAEKVYTENRKIARETFEKAKKDLVTANELNKTAAKAEFDQKTKAINDKTKAFDQETKSYNKAVKDFHAKSSAFEERTRSFEAKTKAFEERTRAYEAQKKALIPWTLSQKLPADKLSAADVSRQKALLAEQTRLQKENQTLGELNGRSMVVEQALVRSPFSSPDALKAKEDEVLQFNTNVLQRTDKKILNKIAEIDRLSSSMKALGRAQYLLVRHIRQVHNFGEQFLPLTKEGEFDQYDAREQDRIIISDLDMVDLKLTNTQSLRDANTPEKYVKAMKGLLAAQKSKFDALLVDYQSKSAALDKTLSNVGKKLEAGKDFEHSPEYADQQAAFSRSASIRNDIDLIRNGYNTIAENYDLFLDGSLSKEVLEPRNQKADADIKTLTDRINASMAQRIEEDYQKLKTAYQKDSDAYQQVKETYQAEQTAHQELTDTYQKNQTALKNDTDTYEKDKEAYQNELKAIDEAAPNILKAQEDAYQKSLKAYEEQYQKDLKANEEAYHQTQQAQEDTYRKTLADYQSQYDKNVNDLNADYERTEAELDTNYGKTLNDYQEQYNKDYSRLDTEYEQKTSGLTEAYHNTQTQQETQHNERIRALNDARQKVDNEYAASVSNANAEHQNKLRDIENAKSFANKEKFPELYGKDSPLGLLQAETAALKKRQQELPGKITDETKKLASLEKATVKAKDTLGKASALETASQKKLKESYLSGLDIINDFSLEYSSEKEQQLKEDYRSAVAKYDRQYGAILDLEDMQFKMDYLSEKVGEACQLMKFKEVREDPIEGSIFTEKVDPLTDETLNIYDLEGLDKNTDINKYFRDECQSFLSFKFKTRNSCKSYWNDSAVFTAMISSIEVALGIKADPKKKDSIPQNVFETGTREQCKKALEKIRDAAEAYKTAREKDVFQLKNGVQRNYRLGFAKSLIAFANDKLGPKTAAAEAAAEGPQNTFGSMQEGEEIEQAIAEKFCAATHPVRENDNPHADKDAVDFEKIKDTNVVIQYNNLKRKELKELNALYTENKLPTKGKMYEHAQNRVAQEALRRTYAKHMIQDKKKFLPRDYSTEPVKAQKIAAEHERLGINTNPRDPEYLDKTAELPEIFRPEPVEGEKKEVKKAAPAKYAALKSTAKKLKNAEDKVRKEFHDADIAENAKVKQAKAEGRQYERKEITRKLTDEEKAEQAILNYKETMYNKDYDHASDFLGLNRLIFSEKEVLSQMAEAQNQLNRNANRVAPALAENKQDEEDSKIIPEAGGGEKPKLKEEKNLGQREQALSGPGLFH